MAFAAPTANSADKQRAAQPRVARYAPNEILKQAGMGFGPCEVLTRASMTLHPTIRSHKANEIL